MKRTDDEIEQAVAALLACPRAEDAARRLGVSRTTLWRMSQGEEFQHRLREARSRLSREIVISLQANALEAVSTLRGVMLDQGAPASARVTAAGKLIELSLRAKEQLETEERLDALEHALGRRKGK